MKNIVMNVKYIILCVLFFTCLPSIAQQTKPIDINQVEFEWCDSLNIGFYVTIPNKSISKNYRLIETPWLIGKDDSLALPPFEIRGKRFHRYYKRKMKLQGIDCSKDDYSVPGETFLYEVKLPIMDWMKTTDMNLVLHSEMEGCCRMQTLSSILLAENINVPTPAMEIIPLPIITKSLADILAEKEPILQSIDQYQPYNPNEPLRRMPDAQIVYFELSDTIIDAGYRENLKTLEKIVDITHKINNDTLSQLVCVRIVGLASLDGPVESNNRIARARAKALKEYLAQATSSKDEIFEVINGGEAWADFRDAIAESNVEYKDKVLQLIDTTPNRVECERKLRNIDNGTIWLDLRKRFLNENRNAGYIRMYYENNK